MAPTPKPKGELLATKFIPPEIAEDVVARPQLNAELYQAVSSRRLTLLSAPAGAGKTTAVLGLKQAHPDLKLAWVALDEGDEDASIFTRLVAEAIARIYPHFGAQTQQLLLGNAQREIAPIHLASGLVNDLAAQVPNPLTIVLDDLHRVDSKPVNELLDYLIERIPAHIHLVITSRHDPPLRLAQLRSRNQLAEFRLDRLRLSLNEIAGIVNAAAGRPLATADLELVNERTDGWAAGVRLVALSLGQLATDDQRSALLHKLAASQRLLFDYLVEEVLDRADQDTRDFLVQTSILAELTPRLCSLVTQRKESAALLNTLYRQNYFLTAIETSDPESPQGYRYHPLFAQFLQKQLAQREDLDLAALHLRAAQATGNPELRIEHLLNAAAWEQAIAAIIEIGKAQCERSFINQKTINWIARIPAEERTDHYWLDLIEACYARQKGLQQRSVELSRQALVAAETAGDSLGMVESAWNLAVFRDNPTAIQRLDELMVQRSVLSPTRRAYYLIGKSWTEMDTLNWESIQQYFERFLEIARQSNSVDLYYSTAQHIGPQMLFIDDGIAKIDQFDTHVLNQISQQPDGVLQAGPFLRRAWISFLQCNLASASDYNQRFQRIARMIGGFAFLDIISDYVLLNLMIVTANYAGIEDYVTECEVRLQAVETHRRNLPAYIFSLWRAQWLQAQPEQAQATMQRFLAGLNKEILALSPTVPIMKGWQAFSEDRRNEAERQLIEAAQRHHKMRWVGTWGHAGLDLALFYYLLGEEDKALNAWSKAAQEIKQRAMPGAALINGRSLIPLLELAIKKEKYPDIAAAALQAFGQPARPRSIPVPNTGETLTSREVEVLQLLTAGASNKEIASTLVITPRTAKAHVSNILTKLQVSTRSEAIARTHELALLKPPSISRPSLAKT